MIKENNFTPLEWAILQTVAYADVFDYPITHHELHRYLIGVKATPKTIEDTLTTGHLYQHYLSNCDGYLTFAGRENTVAIRSRRAELAQELWPVAHHYGAMIGQLPFVRMVAVTGSLAVDNVGRNADIDYMIVTEPGRLWLARLFVIGIVKMVKQQGYVLCPNYLITENALEIQEQNLFTARELCQMVPVCGMETYDAMRQVNRWTDAYFPNADERPTEHPYTVATRKLLRQRAGELPFRTPVGGWLDQWEMKRKINKLAYAANGEPEADYTADWCKGHIDGHMRRVLNHFQQRLDQISPIQSHTNGHHRNTPLTLQPHPIKEEENLMPKAKVLFGQSYYLRFDPKLWEAMQPYPPLGTLYAAAYMRERGFDVTLFDAMLAESEQAWAESLDREQPDYAIIYEDNFNYLSKMCLARMRQAALTMIDMAKIRDCTVIVCGSDATDHTDVYLTRGADYVLVGEGEATLGELMDVLTGQSDTALNDVLGLAYAGNPTPQRRTVMKKLDELPLPAWDLVDVDQYKAIWYGHHGYYSMNMVTTRGCPYHCNWCAKPIWGQRYNVHSPERVVEQMQHLIAHYQPDHIWFADDIMGLKPGWMERFADLIEQNNITMPFKCLSRADLLLRGDTVNALKRAGCDIVWIGAESGAQKILDAMEKGTKVAEIHEAAHKLHDAGVRVGFFLQFGYPGETREDIEKTLQLVRDSKPDDIGISVSYPLPGTSFHERVKNELGARQHWQDSSDLAMLYQGPFATDFYRQLHTVVHKEFRSRKTRDKLTGKLKAAFHSGVIRDTAAMVYHTATLPLARRKLDKLANLPHEGIIPLAPRMDYAAASIPTPQDEG